MLEFPLYKSWPHSKSWYWKPAGRWSTSISLFVALAATSNAEGATNLKESYQAALKRSETLASQEKLVEIAETRYSQAWGSILPNLTANASYMIQDQPSNVLAQSFFPRTQPEAKLTVRQPIFRGLREFAALRQQRQLSESEKHTHEHATLLLYNDVAQMYHAVLAAEENLKNNQVQLKLYDEQIGELGRRVRAGTSNETDLLTLQSSRANVRSQFETARAGVMAARESYAFVTGFARGTELASIELKQPKPQPVMEYLETLEERPDLRGMAVRAQAAHEQVDIVKSAHFPTVDLLGNYYFIRQSDVYQGINWDVQAVVSIPILSGGLTTAQVRESALQSEREELELTRLRRRAEQQVRTLHSDYVAGLDSIVSLEQSLQLADKNYQLLRRDFRRGLTRNLDVLQALIASHETRQALLRARFATRDTWVQLNTAAGNRPPL